MRRRYLPPPFSFFTSAYYAFVTETVIRGIRAREPVQQDSFAKAYRKSCERKQFAEPKKIRSSNLPVETGEETGMKGVVLREVPVYIFQNASASLDDCQRA